MSRVSFVYPPLPLYCVIYVEREREREWGAVRCIAWLPGKNCVGPISSLSTSTCTRGKVWWRYGGVWWGGARACQAQAGPALPMLSRRCPWVCKLSWRRCT